MKADDYNGDLSGFLTLYKYQPELTKRLDSICSSQIINPANKYIQI